MVRKPTMKKNIAGLLIICSSSIAPFGEGPGRFNVNEQPQFKPVFGADGFFDGTLKDQSTETLLTEVSFGGITTIDNVFTDNDDSYNSISLAEIAQITVLEPLHESAKHSSKSAEQFFVKTRVSLRTKTGKITTTEFLFPLNTVISGKQKDTGVKKAWLLRNITSLAIKKSAPDDITEKLRALEAKNATHAAPLEKPTPPAPTQVPLWHYMAAPVLWIWEFIKRLLQTLLHLMS
jgi:hypothetical protein